MRFVGRTDALVSDVDIEAKKGGKEGGREGGRERGRARRTISNITMFRTQS